MTIQAVRGACTRCGHWPLLREDGTVRVHRMLSNRPQICPGSYQPPRSTTKPQPSGNTQ